MQPPPPCRRAAQPSVSGCCCVRKGTNHMPVTATVLSTYLPFHYSMQPPDVMFLAHPSVPPYIIPQLAFHVREHTLYEFHRDSLLMCVRAFWSACSYYFSATLCHGPQDMVGFELDKLFVSRRAIGVGAQDLGTNCALFPTVRPCLPTAQFPTARERRISFAPHS